MVSIFISWKYRFSFIPLGQIYFNGNLFDKYQLKILNTENIIGEGILYGFGAVGFMVTIKILEGFLLKLDEKYNINFFKKRTKK